MGGRDFEEGRLVAAVLEVAQEVVNRPKCGLLGGRFSLFKLRAKKSE